MTMTADEVGSGWLTVVSAMCYVRWFSFDGQEESIRSVVCRVCAQRL